MGRDYDPDKLRAEERKWKRRVGWEWVEHGRRGGVGGPVGWIGVRDWVGMGRGGFE